MSEKGIPVGTALPDTWRSRRAVHDLPDPLLDEIAARFRLLGEPLRLKQLATLADGEQSVGALVAATGANQSNVSRHLAALSHGGLVTRRKAGTTIYYRLADPGVLTLCDVVCAGVQERYAARMQALGLTNPVEQADE